MRFHGKIHFTNKLFSKMTHLYTLYREVLNWILFERF